MEPIKGYTSVPQGTVKDQEVKQVVEVLKVNSQNLAGLAREKDREMWEHDGLCACGKRTYVFSRCPTCIRREAQDAVVEAQERKEREERGDLEELDGAALIEEVGAASNMCEPDGTTEVVGIKTIQLWGGGSRRWDKGHSPEIPRLSGDQVEKYPCRTVWAVEPDGTVLTVQNCCKVGWALQGLNWHCHRSVVNAQCDSAWKTGSKEMSARFNCLIGLIGVPVGRGMERRRRANVGRTQAGFG